MAHTIPEIHYEYDIDHRNQRTMVSMQNAYSLTHYTRCSEQNGNK